MSPRFPQPRLHCLRALALGLAIGLASPVFAQTDSLGEIQRLMKQGQMAQALDKADGYVASRPKDPQGRFLKGLILAEMNRSGEAITVFTKLTEDFPELPEPYNNLAVLYAQQKQYDKARTALEMAIRTHPSYAVAHENLGDVYAKLASQAYDKALQIDSSNTVAQTKLALIRELISTSAGKSAAKPAAPAPTQVAAAAPPPAPVRQPVARVYEPPKPVEPQKAVEPQRAVEPPRPAPVDPVADSGSSPIDVQRAVQGWASAWSRKDVRGYLAFYAPHFQTPNGMSRRDWETERELRIEKPGRIQVGVENVRVTMNGSDKATVRFRQHYSSASLKSSGNKTLVLERIGGKWLITQEHVS